MNATCESITKKLFQPCPNLILKLKVVLGSRNMNGYRRRFISEYDFTSNKYKDLSSLAAVQIETEDFFIVETFMSWEARQKLNDQWESQKMLFTYNNIHQLMWSLDTAYSWLSNPKELCEFDKTTGGISHLKTVCQNYFTECLTDVKFSEPNMRFYPTIKTFPDEHRELAVLVTMGPRNSQVATLTLNELASWIYFMQHFDMASASMLTVNQTLVAMPMIRPVDMKKNGPKNDV